MVVLPEPVGPVTSSTPLGLAWHFDGRVYSVLPLADHDALTRPLVHHIFRPNYMSAAELERLLTQFLSPRGRLVVSEKHMATDQKDVSRLKNPQRAQKAVGVRRRHLHLHTRA